MEDWKEPKEEKEKKYVTRKEFYICFIILLAAVFWQGSVTRDRLQQERNNLTHSISSLDNQVSNISSSVRSALEEQTRVLLNPNVSLADADLKNRMATLSLSGTPKEYQSGMTVTFLVSCDGAEALAFPAKEGTDRKFSAEVVIPFCDYAEVTAVLKKDGTEYLESMGNMDINGQAIPYINGHHTGSVSYSSYEDFAQVEGGVSVTVQAPEMLLHEKSGEFQLKNARTEIYVDEKLKMTVPMERFTTDPYFMDYEGQLSEELKLKDHQYIKFVFKAEDNFGNQYAKLLEYAYFMKGVGYEQKEYPIAFGDYDNNSLSIE